MFTLGKAGTLSAAKKKKFMKMGNSSDKYKGNL